METKRISELEELENLDNYPYFLAEEEGVAKRVPSWLVKANWENLESRPFGEEHFTVDVVPPCELSFVREEGTNTYSATVDCEPIAERSFIPRIIYSESGDYMVFWFMSKNDDGYICGTYDYYYYNGVNGVVTFFVDPEQTVTIKIEFDYDIGEDVFKWDYCMITADVTEYREIEERYIPFEIARVEDIPTWDALDNKPFYTADAFTVEYDGARTPYAAMECYIEEEGVYLYRISDKIPSEEQMKNASAVYYNADSGESQSFDSVNYYDCTDSGSTGPGEGQVYQLSFGDGHVFVTTGWASGVSVNHVDYLYNFSEPGIYTYGTINGGTSHVESITFPEEVKTIDPKYIPNSTASPGCDMLSVSIVETLGGAGDGETESGALYSCSKSYEDVYNALTSYKPIYAVYRDDISSENHQVLFTSVFLEGETVVFGGDATPFIYLKADGSMGCYSQE